MHKSRVRVTLLLLLISNIYIVAQINIGDKVTLSGSLQSDILFPEYDESIGTEDYSEWGLTNTYLDLNLMSKYVSAGARFEYLEHPLPGFEKDFAGWGVPYFYAMGKYKNVELTVGDFYDQFGSGLIFRTYEERSLGIDNSLRGGRLKFQPYKGINIKALGGKQRRYWEHNDGLVWGADAEFNIEQWSQKMQEDNTYLMFGASYAGKHQKSENILVDPTHKLNLPENVGAFDFRIRFQKGNYNILAEYAIKGNDPSADNNYIYKNGNALLLSGSYSKRGMSILLQAKRSDNMSYRSARGDIGISSFINHLPAFAFQHTYALASLYPYATQPEGEWAYQGEFSYTFSRGTLLGGKYGTNVKLNASHIREIDKTFVGDQIKGSNGYTSSFFKTGDETYYQDINISLEKKISRAFKINAMYMNQRYNQKVIEQHAVNGDIVNSHIGVLEGKYQFSKKVTARAEIQYLNTKQDLGDWMFGLIEVSVLPSLMLTISDMYNNGTTNLHYYMASATYIYKSHRLQIGYGRTRAGYNCSGGVCRYVPASKGFQISYNVNL